jgi:hypothetical protein
MNHAVVAGAEDVVVSEWNRIKPPRAGLDDGEDVLDVPVL